MTNEQIGEIIYELFVLILQIAGPLLVISMIVGICISIIQAATQIHEQTITFVPKLLVIGLILVFGGGRMMESLAHFTIQIFELI
ncbi:flagellar biosynthetic protein FliQ [Schaedlerella arabinosiphila]|uniref:Flagellar biosynthetic protein FliQ n=1 Tax=Schaedlerella arabinosiphila TaxID=2044587 RepID=A0A3R8LHV8_9FIRM|nr:flagellar biosynthetic protein FliQ [Schaedlerella arabinosiphila]MDE7066634.1 flagellar biosynthetic protein FliQ [Schaedlerella arabinosiphila]RRK33671.1 flagellar biosynthetic protein FliQ [Schaedlerella arabinosiphila]